MKIKSAIRPLRFKTSKRNYFLLSLLYFSTTTPQTRSRRQLERKHTFYLLVLMSCSGAVRSEPPGYLFHRSSNNSEFPCQHHSSLGMPKLFSLLISKPRAPLTGCGGTRKAPRARAKISKVVDRWEERGANTAVTTWSHRSRGPESQQCCRQARASCN